MNVPGYFLKAVIEHNESKINELNQCLTEKCDHATPLPTYFHPWSTVTTMIHHG